VSQPRLSYRFGPLERRGLLGPVRGGQAAALVAGALVAVVALDLAPSPTGVAIAIVAFGAAIAIALTPFASRTLDEWLPLVSAFASRRLTRRTSFRSAIPARGIAAGTGQALPGTADESSTAEPPPALRGARIVEVPYRDRPMGAISERDGRWLTAVLACRVAAFSLLDPEAQERRLARWGLVLSGSASTAIRRIQWVERTAPAQGDELARWLHAERDPAVPLRGTAMIESYLELIGTTARVTQEHEILLAVQVDARRTRDRGAETGFGALVEQTERVAHGLEAAEVTVAGALTAGQLSRALRTAFDPYARAELAALEAADPTRDGLAETNAWPLGADEGWEHYRSDGAVHATYWIAGWPRIDVSPMFMDALLGRSSTVRSVAVTFEPIAPQRSTREIEAAVGLRRASAEVLEHAARARLELHCMYGQQAEAFTFTLPICRGLR
jgi:hypothetical protein